MEEAPISSGDFVTIRAENIADSTTHLSKATPRSPHEIRGSELLNIIYRI